VPLQVVLVMIKEHLLLLLLLHPPASARVFLSQAGRGSQARIFFCSLFFRLCSF
jgi:hypothetical protein